MTRPSYGFAKNIRNRSKNTVYSRFSGAGAEAQECRITKSNMTHTTMEERFDEYEKSNAKYYPMGVSCLTKEETVAFITTEIERAYNRGYYEGEKNEFHNQAGRIEEAKREVIDQKHYELAMQAQAIQMFMDKDAEEYGETALHGKFRAFFSKYIQPTLQAPDLSDKED